MASIEDRARAMFRKFRSEIARAGGNARAKNMTPEQRSAAARKAARARWKKVKAACVAILAALLIASPIAASTHKATPHASTSKCKTCARDSHGKIQRGKKAVQQFKKQTGYPKGRKGYVVDHVVPLACGGADVPSNMAWQSKAEAAAKDKIERQGCTR